MTEPVDHKKATQDAEWLAGSEADTAERNLARAYLALVAALPEARADKERLDWFDHIWKDDDTNALDKAWQSSTPGPAGSGRAGIDAARAAEPPVDILSDDWWKREVE
jgi:hypothetical protein